MTAVVSAPPGRDDAVYDESGQDMVELQPISATGPDDTDHQSEIAAEQDRVC